MLKSIFFDLGKHEKVYNVLYIALDTVSYISIILLVLTMLVNTVHTLLSPMNALWILLEVLY